MVNCESDSTSRNLSLALSFSLCVSHDSPIIAYFLLRSIITILSLLIGSTAIITNSEIVKNDCIQKSIDGISYREWKWNEVTATVSCTLLNKSTHVSESSLCFQLIFFIFQQFSDHHWKWLLRKSQNLFVWLSILFLSFLLTCSLNCSLSVVHSTIRYDYRHAAQN